MIDTLESFKIPFVALLDTCSEGKEQDFRYSVLSAAAQRNLRDVAGILRVVNEFRDTYPVLFSAQPGKVAKTVEDPRDSFSSIGPIARRLTLIFDRANQSAAPLPLGRVLNELTSAALDSQTKPEISHTEKLSFPMLISEPTVAAGKVEHVTASASQPSICCRKQAATAPASRRVTGTLQLKGKSDEFITGGKSYELVSPPATFTVTNLDAGRISIEVDDIPGSPWSASFETNDGNRFAPKNYFRAQRFDFGDKGRPTLEVSGNGHACNRIEGSYSVDSVEYEPDGTLQRLRLKFTQVCDDVRTPLTGLLELSIDR